MQKTSIHICPVKASSEEHNQRLKPLDYVKQELTEKNQSVIHATIPDTLKKIKQQYRASTGQRMQKKATPIREGVIVVAPKTTLKDLQKLADRFEERFKIKTFQIYLHDDEGHKNKAGEWVPNRHAHFVINWTDEQGKSLKLSKDDMAEMQTITAETLGMERGQSSDKKHLSAIQYKNEIQKQELQLIEKERNKAKLDLIKTKAENYTAKTGESLKKGLFEGIKRITGADKATAEINEAKKEVEALQKQLEAERAEHRAKMQAKNAELESANNFVKASRDVNQNLRARLQVFEQKSTTLGKGNKL